MGVAPAKCAEVGDDVSHEIMKVCSQEKNILRCWMIGIIRHSKVAWAPWTASEKAICWVETNSNRQQIRICCLPWLMTERQTARSTLHLRASFIRYHRYSPNTDTHQWIPLRQNIKGYAVYSFYVLNTTSPSGRLSHMLVSSNLAY